MQAQVTIGSQTKPDSAVLLQIKEYETISGSGAETAKKGIILPRVKLKSLSDITVISETNKDKVADLAGLLVYNVNTSEMSEGIYVWNGWEWEQLEIFAEKEGTNIQKSIVKTSNLNADNVPVVNIGRFAFRFSPKQEVQCKMTVAPSANETIWFNICRFGTPETGSIYAYDSNKFIFTSTNFSTWTNFYSTTMANDERWEIWFADIVNDKAYNIQFIIYAKLQIPTYIILVTEY
jgi:hypothetical protein